MNIGLVSIKNIASMNEDENEIPDGSKRIYFAQISGDIIKKYYKQTLKYKFCVNDVYKDGEEHVFDSYFMRMIKNKLHLEKTEDEFKITEIVKLKYIGFSIPNIK